MHDFFFQWLALFLIVLTAAAAPGPDFIVVIRNSVLHSQRAGIITAFGIALGNMFHVAYCIIGIATLINQSELLFSIIKYTGVIYLVYVGVKGLFSKGYESVKIIGDDKEDRRVDLPAMKAFKNGFFTNLLNPKATMFYLALFTQLLEGTTMVQQIIYALTVAFIAIGWFSLVSILLNRRTLRRKFLHYAKWIDRICGGLLIALGVRLAISKA